MKVKLRVTEKEFFVIFENPKDRAKMMRKLKKAGWEIEAEIEVRE